MRLEQHINVLLKEWDYDQALQLYEAHSKNSILVFTLQAGANSFNESLLRQELEKLKAEIVEVPVVSSSPKDTFIDYRTAPEPLIAVKKQYQKDISDMKVLHAGLATQPTDEARFTAAKKIIRLNESIHKAYQQMDHYKKTGTLLPEVPKVVMGYSSMDRAELKTLYENKRTYIAKAKKAIRQLHDQLKGLDEGETDKQLALKTKVEAKEEKIQLLTAEREEIQTILNHG